MARAAAASRHLGRRPPRTGTLVALCVTLLSALAVCRSLGPAAFAPSLTSRSRLRGGARSARVACAARGGEASVVEEYKVGDKVKALSEDDGQWYPGKIHSVANDGTYTVTWDDPDGGPETAELGADGLKKIVRFKDYAVGDDCKAESPDDSTWYPGTVSAINKDGTFTVTWDDPDGGPDTATIEPEKMKKVTVFKGYKQGDEVLAVFPDDGEWYSAIVKKAVKAKGTFVVKWDDPDGGPEESELSPKKMKLPPIPLDKLKVGAKYTGRVSSVRDFGAFVDFGAEANGMVHISRVTGERIASIYDHVEEGQEVDVWVTEVGDDGKVRLSMVEGLVSGRPGRGSYDYAAFEGISPSEWLEGTVTRVAPFGAFVLVKSPGGAEANGMVHVSAIRDGYVEDVSSELREGDEVKVRVTKLDVDQGKMSLSMKEESSMAGASRLPADLSSFENMSPDEWVDGKVARIAGFGAFVTVTLEDGSSADGLVHITQIKDGFVEAVEDELEVGQGVKVRIISVDPAARKMSLSMKGK